MNSEENIIPEGSRTVYIENVGTIIVPKRNTEQEILDIAEELKDDLDTLKELFSVVKVCDEDIKDKDKQSTIPNNTPFGMNEENKKALEVLNNKGKEEFMKHVFTDQETGRKLSYSEMRMRYG
tara:strand:- start:416 stop:784 length:369 start_codon:yes stop_codon:yes gene_type:complete